MTKLFKSYLLSLLITITAHAVIFVNETKRDLTVTIVPPSFKITHGISCETIQPDRITLMSTYEKHRTNCVFYDGTITNFFIEQADHLCFSTFPLFRGSLSPEIIRYLFEHPYFQISVSLDHSTSLEHNRKVNIKPTLIEVEELAIKETRAKAKPIVREAIKELPGGVKDIITEYYNPLEENKE